VNKEDFFDAWPARSRLKRDWAKERKLWMPPSISFETGRKTPTQSSVKTAGRRQQMEVWFYLR
jgi:hypothetical protein